MTPCSFCSEELYRLTSNLNLNLYGKWAFGSQMSHLIHTDYGDATQVRLDRVSLVLIPCRRLVRRSRRTCNLPALQDGFNVHQGYVVNNSFLDYIRCVPYKNDQCAWRGASLTGIRRHQSYGLSIPSITLESGLVGHGAQIDISRRIFIEMALHIKLIGTAWYFLCLSIFNIRICSFLPRDAMQSAIILRQVVRLSVRLSGTLR